ncbi:hypothetical protein HIM_04262 [Hirsutella minnesotensis 3608]|uniref:protein O-GlcNAc transferase n=1 Tax=Hirsutella minnesotensis 3608 TaxID=1043627 RepID=A0A0F7ZPV9_9HYPO|nr:hypothetical protein HIM_04262 [Hirsutella minnesotensis 3608]
MAQLNMLPEPQPRLHPVAPRLDAFAEPLSFQDRGHDVTADTASQPRHVQDFSASYSRCLPIRAGRLPPNQHALVQPVAPSSLLPGEHKLRRKTPRGTVDAGYDGSPIKLSPGPPALKQMIIATSSHHHGQHHGLGNSGPPHSRRSWSDCRPHPEYRLDSGDQHSQAQLTQIRHVGGNASYLTVPTAQYGGPMSGSQSLHGGARSLFASGINPPVLRANDQSVRAIRHPLPTHDLLPFSQTLQRFGSSPWNCDALGQPYIPAHNHEGVTSSLMSQTGVCNLPGQLVPGCTASPTHKRQIVELEGTEPPTLCQASGGKASNTRSATQKKALRDLQEGALRHAEQCYHDLLAFLQANGRANPLRANCNISTTQFTISGYAANSKPLKTTSKSSDQIHQNGLPKGSKLDSPHGNSGNQCLRTNHTRVDTSRFAVLADSDQTGAFHCSQPNTLTLQVPLMRGPVIGNPTSNAVASVAILERLCEQSDWRWLEGMLTGGCLYYSLGKYEAALTWFSRILAINSSHVEAITNLAATLFCLNRQGEAERLWLRAVELRPSYLEATEHLVGLLYKKRSHEAVYIISKVQRSLKVSSPRGTHTGHTETHGFASCGYALPGCENGRILALIHAKGTILYGLKEIGKASEAFEEAVMISVGWRFNGIRELIRCVQGVLSQAGLSSVTDGHASSSLRTLMLPPERARCTAQLLFSGSGELPGLLYLRNGTVKRAAIQTTSNSLLSLAKIFQDSMANGNADSAISQGTSSVCDILALYYLSLSLQESPSTANNVGILLAGIQHTALKVSKAHAGDISGVDYPGIPPGSGMALALSYYNYGLRLDSKHVHLHTNLGSLLKDIGQLDLAIQMYERAVSCDGTFDIALTNLANAVKDKGRINDAIVYYRRAVASNPNFAEAVCGLFTALNSVCSWRGRGGAILASGEYDRWHVDDGGQLIDAKLSGCGSGLTKRVVDIISLQLKEASRWGQHLLQESIISALAQQLQDFCESPSFRIDEALRQWAGRPWEGSRLTRLIERAMRVILRRSYLDIHVNGTMPKLQYVRPTLPSNMTTPAAPTVLPFHTFTCPLSASDIRSISQRNAMRISCSALRLPWLPSTMYSPPSPPNPHLNVGYISSDFNNHPLAHLMQSVFGLHDERRVRAICYATTPSDRSVHRQQIEKEAPVFRDMSSWSPEKIIAQIVQDQIHILVNLNGYTRGARNEIFAARPAPIQMSFMGFAGSLGAEWCDYILADETSIPPSTLRPWRRNVSIEDVFSDGSEEQGGEWIYSENVIFCRDTFFCCDHAQSSANDEKGVTWEEEIRRRWTMRKDLFPALEDDAIIMGNFNQLYKIEPTTFRTWLRILSRVPKAVLWLLRFPEPGESNLRSTAEMWAGREVASRLIFTDVAPKTQHIARARVCDLFLDTPECNAHTTAADVLWSSTPLLTLPRYPYKMCSRMAASILRGALPRSEEGRQVVSELIAGDEGEYEKVAVDLASSLTYVETRCCSGVKEGRGRLAEIRRLLWESKWTCGLFDTRRWVKDLETAYEESWRRWVSGAGGDIFL